MKAARQGAGSPLQDMHPKDLDDGTDPDTGPADCSPTATPAVVFLCATETVSRPAYGYSQQSMGRMCWCCCTHFRRSDALGQRTLRDHSQRYVRRRCRYPHLRLSPHRGRVPLSSHLGCHHRHAGCHRRRCRRHLRHGPHLDYRWSKHRLWPRAHRCGCDLLCCGHDHGT
jgi:hypothetical protein